MDSTSLLRAYNKIAEELGGYRRKLWPEAIKILKDTKPDTILDIGSGNAFYAKTIESLGHKLIISDFAIKQLELARREGVANPAFVSDVRKVPIKNSSFRLVTAFAVWHHMQDEKSRVLFLKEIKRVLKPGGLALLSVIRTTRGGFDASIPFGKIDRYYHFFTRRELVRLIESVGFSEYKIFTSPIKTSKRITVRDKSKKISIGNYFIKIKR